MVVDPGCMKCMDCISVCPNDALYFGFGKPSIAVARPAPKNHPLTWREEVAALAVFAASYWAAWDVYQLVPMLMALGIASITAFLALTTVKMLRARDLSFHRFDLKASGRMRGAGWGFAGFALLWIGLNAHSGFVRHHESAGARAFEGVQVPDELALARANPDAWLSPTDRRNIASGKRHLHAARDAGLLVNREALSKLAWLEYLAGNSDGAVALLGTAAEYQRGQGRALSLYYRGAILNRLGRYREALASLDQALAERSDLILAREERGESLWQLAHRQEAVSAWQDAVGINAGLVLANNLLAGAAALSGRPEAAIAHEASADRHTPANPFFHWVIGLRLQAVGMGALAEKHFRRAIDLDPGFRSANRR
jgi:tetratricopeptide (TPR) repeat protein